MPSRSEDVVRAEGTGNWIFENAKYRSWKNASGILWIIGRAGSGKSVLMDHVVEQTRDPDTVKLAFFFHQTGNETQRSALGLYMALLHQLLDQCRDLMAQFQTDTDFKHRCKSQGTAGDQWYWTERELQPLVDKYLRKCHEKGNQIYIFLDAIDEYASQKVPILIELLRKLSSELGPGFFVCASCRPFSPAGTRYVVPELGEVSVNIEEEIKGDMSTFLDQRFKRAKRIKSALDIEYIKDGILAKASCVFKWIEWMTRAEGPITALMQSPEDAEYVLDRVKGFPPELGDVYETALKGIDDSDVAKAFRIFECLTIARRPLYVAELSHLICLKGSGERMSTVGALKSSQHFCKNKGQLEWRIDCYSSGLIKRKKVSLEMLPGTNRFGYVEVCEFDHVSVQEYLTDRGLVLLQSRIKAAVPPASLPNRHLSIARRCLNYLSTKEVTDLPLGGAPITMSEVLWRTEEQAEGNEEDEKENDEAEDDDEEGEEEDEKEERHEEKTRS